jgi:hypothetical protein
MRKHPSTVRFDGPALAAAVLCGLALSCAGVARADLPVHEVIVPLQGPTEADRAVSLKEALRVVAVRASGRRDAGSSAAVAGADPSRYVQRYSMTPDRMLKVGFDGRAVGELLQQAGLPQWPAERPVVAVTAPDVDPAELERAAHVRGVPLSWAAGGEGGARATLTGVADGGQVAWSFSHAGQTVQARGSAGDGIDLAADALASRYAPASTRTTTSLVLRIGGIDDLPAYAGLMAYLESLSLVRSVVVESLEAAVVRLRMDVRGDRDLLGRIAALDGRLQPSPAATGAAEPGTDFVYLP